MLKKLSKKNKIIVGIILLLILTILIIVGIMLFKNYSYASGSSVGCLTTNLGNENYKELEIIGSSKLTDEEALSLIPMTFNISNTCDTSFNYDLVIEVNRLTNIDLDNLKIEINGEIINFSSLTLIPSDRGLIRYTLKSDLSLAGKVNIDNTFRIWEFGTEDDTDNEGKIISVNMMVIGK